MGFAIFSMKCHQNNGRSLKFINSITAISLSTAMSDDCTIALNKNMIYNDENRQKYLPSII